MCEQFYCVIVEMLPETDLRGFHGDVKLAFSN
jgi:hypothetical protein